MNECELMGGWECFTVSMRVCGWVGGSTSTSYMCLCKESVIRVRVFIWNMESLERTSVATQLFAMSVFSIQ